MTGPPVSMPLVVTIIEASSVETTFFLAATVSMGVKFSFLKGSKSLMSMLLCSSFLQ